MKILLIMDPGISVPPKSYGGHERLVYMFAEEYIKMGHEVTVLAGPDSYCSGRTICFGANNLNKNKFQRLYEMIYVWIYLIFNIHKYNLIHNFGRLAYLIPVLNRNVNKIMTYGRPVSQKGIKIVNKIPNKNIVFTACSNDCVSTGNVAGRWETVYNCIDFSKYDLNENVNEDAPLIFLGRIEKIKGVHTAIQVALETNNKLIIAGNKPDLPDAQKYFKEEIEPFIDGEQIKYVGPINDSEKNKYLGTSKALLFPIEWNEPFGMVMAEAMACGTPVIGFNRGSVSEVIIDGKSGFVVNSKNEMKNAIYKIFQIKRKDCRMIAESRFDVNIIAKNYLDLL